MLSVKLATSVSRLSVLVPTLAAVMLKASAVMSVAASPSNTAQQPGDAFPPFTLRDMVASQAAVLDALGVDRLHAVIDHVTTAEGLGRL